MSATPDERAAALLSQMTLDEKTQQLTAVMPFGLIGVDGPTAEQLECVLAGGIGQISGFSSFGHLLPGELARSVNMIQRYLVEETRLGIPAIFHLEALNGLVAPGFTTFPTAIGLAATWNPTAVEEMAAILARQMRAIGFTQALSPVMDIARDARWGRVHESYGEDPHLVSAFSVAYTRGLQGDDLESHAIATGKHFLGFGMTEGGQHMAATMVSGRAMREEYARPFEAAIRYAGLGSIMNSYSTVDGVPVGANRRILTALLREELNFTGTVVSDYGTIANLVDRQGVAIDLKDAARLALQAGMDVELPAAKAYGPTLAEAVRAGLVDETLVDRSVLRVLRDKYALGLFDHPYVVEDGAALTKMAIEGSELAARLARESVTLLRNDGQLLPLSKAAQRVAVIGPHAETVDIAFPGYTYYASLAMIAGAAGGQQANMAGIEEAGSALGPGVIAALLSQLRPALAEGMDRYARSRYGAQSLTDAIRAAAPDADVVSVRGCGVLDDEPADIAAAVEAAREADIVILALGGRPGWFGQALTEGEGSDRADVELPSVQVELARALAGIGVPVVGVVFTGRPFALEALDDVLPAVLYPFYGGQAAMPAVAEALFGDINPSGKLPISIPRHSGQVPLHHGQHLGTGYRRAPADAYTGYTDLPSTPRYAFGHGLSYTTFEYADLVLDTPVIDADGDIRARVRVTNAGNCRGVETVQFYASHRAELVTRPAQELVGFARVDLAAGESALVDITFSTGQMAYLGADGAFIFDPGPLELSVGSSSDDIRLRDTVAVGGRAADWSTDRPMFPIVQVSK